MRKFFSFFCKSCRGFFIDIAVAKDLAAAAQFACCNFFGCLNLLQRLSKQGSRLSRSGRELSVTPSAKPLEVVVPVLLTCWKRTDL